MKKLTGFAISASQEGTLLTFSYSIINEQGVIEKRNENESRIVVNEAFQKELDDVKNYIIEKYLTETI